MPDSALEQTLTSLAARYTDALGVDSALRVSFFVDDDGDLCVRLLVYDDGALFDGCDFAWGTPLDQLDLQSPRVNAFLDAHVQLSRELVDLGEPDSPLVQEGFASDLLDDARLQTSGDFLRAIKERIDFALHTEPEPEARRARRNITEARKGPQPRLFTFLESVTPDEMVLEDALDHLHAELSALDAEQRAEVTPWLIGTFDLLSASRHLDTQVRHKGKRVFYKEALALALGQVYEQWNGIPLVPTREM
ncbi:hypothetical protein LZ198_25555 [Myxococcus sp. K15C18031901]|uniref:hypothetical protein n=1 Tax=Myxococcus dinghuensis TaxID=2906761 RepID=UPI0020A73CAD|nr:hypothetical protein [Myxococcus dinghuensis]MCP3102240.1 hypothetical protein [Myxococcus dinghuensis]